MKPIELESYFDELDPDTDTTNNLEPQLVYLEGLSNLRAHYFAEATLPGRMNQLIDEVNPIRQRLERMRGKYCFSENPGELPLATRMLGPVFDCNVPGVFYP